MFSAYHVICYNYFHCHKPEPGAGAGAGCEAEDAEAEWGGVTRHSVGVSVVTLAAGRLGGGSLRIKDLQSKIV